MMDFIIQDNTAVLEKYHGHETHVKIPARFNGFPVTKIGPHAFEGNNLYFLDLPASLTEIGDGAFKECTQLYCVSFDLPENRCEKWIITDGGHLSRLPPALTKIGAEAFCSTGLEDLSIFSTTKVDISPYAFQKCRSLQEVTVYSKELDVGEGGFADCENLFCFDAGHSETTIDKLAFENCRKLALLIFRNVPQCSEDAFDNCPTILSRMHNYNGRFYIDPATLFSDVPWHSTEVPLKDRKCRPETAEDSRNEWNRVIRSLSRDPNNPHFLAARSAILAKLKAEGLPSPFRDDVDQENLPHAF